ncbi:uncharacterized protein LOC136070209 [Quercus suber]|uniref:uncharacterized protein LOC136070209 n=1 Tax=Quercus suber TaxID=58331 RepID=UPI0032E04796
MELLGFTPADDNKTLVGQRLLISRLVEAIAAPLPYDATEIQIHKYARCYILALLGDKLFMDKSKDSVHLMFLEQLRNLRDPPQYSWGSGCLAWLYRELCRASEKGASQIGGACTLVQYWAWARLPFLCPRIEPAPGCDYGPWPYAPLAVELCGSHTRHTSPTFLTSALQGGFGLAQERPDGVVYDERLHKIDLRGKVEKNWRQEHEPYIISWNSREQRLCHAPPQTGEMVRDHNYYRWYGPVTLKYVDRNSARLHQLIESHLALLNWVPANNRIETESATIAAPSTSAAPVTTPTRARRDTASPSTSVARGRGRLAIASPSPSTTRGRGRPTTASPSPIAARGRGRPAIASPRTSAATSRGRRATTPRVVSSHEIPAPILHASPHPEVPPPIPDVSPQSEVPPPIIDVSSQTEVLPPILNASPQSEVPPPMVDASPQPEVPSPTPPSQPSFDLDIHSQLTPPLHPETPSYPPTSSSAPTLPMTMIPTPDLYTEHHYPPISSSSDPVGPPVRTNTPQPDTDVPDENPLPQPSPPRGRPQRARRAPTCGTGGHKIGHKHSSMHDNKPKDDVPQPPPPPKHNTRVKKRKIGEP